MSRVIAVQFDRTNLTRLLEIVSIYHRDLINPHNLVVYFQTIFCAILESFGFHGE